MVTILQKIERLGLESRARTLKKTGLTTRDIADTLSKESGQKIAKSTVADFFKADDILKEEIVESNNKLRAVVIEAEISTIENRQTIITGLLTIASSKETDDKIKIYACKVATEALDSLDKRLGKLSSNTSGITNNINVLKLSEIPTDQLLRMVNVTTQ